MQNFIMTVSPFYNQRTIDMIHVQCINDMMKNTDFISSRNICVHVCVQEK
jgi:hypothetical protein